jgi:hypothetical protein
MKGKILANAITLLSLLLPVAGSAKQKAAQVPSDVQRRESTPQERGDD